MGFKEFLGEMGGVDQIKPGGKNPFIEVGVHALTVNRCVVGKSHPKKGGAFYIATEFTVQTSDNPKHPKGSTVAWILSFKDYPELKMQNFLDFLMRGFGMTEAEAKKAIDTEVVWNDKQILATEKVNCIARKDTGKTSGREFTAYQWSAAA